MKVSVIASVALAAMAAAAPTAQNDKTRRVQGINLTGMTEKELKAVVAKVKKDPEVQEILERLKGTTNEDKMAVMDVAKKGLAYNDGGVLGPFIGRARYVLSSMLSAHLLTILYTAGLTTGALHLMLPTSRVFPCAGVAAVTVTSMASSRSWTRETRPLFWDTMSPTSQSNTVVHT